MKRNLIFLLSIFWIINIQAQNLSPEVISSAGETFQGNNIQIDWTIGEVAITTIQNSTHQLTQGFHQPIYTITAIRELPDEIGQIEIFPNPTSEIINFKLNFDEYQKVRILLFDLNGKQIWKTETEGNKITETTDISSLPNGNYFINFIIGNDQFSSTLKIQKIN